MSATKPSWRDFYAIHPASAVLPMPPQTTLNKLARDIAGNGLKVAIQTREIAGDRMKYLIDGKARLYVVETMLDWQIVNEQGQWIGAFAVIQGYPSKVEHRTGRTHAEVVAEIQSYNLCRQHVDRKQLAELADKLAQRQKMLKS